MVNSLSIVFLVIFNNQKIIIFFRAKKLYIIWNYKFKKSYGDLKYSSVLNGIIKIKIYFLQKIFVICYSHHCDQTISVVPFFVVMRDLVKLRRRRQVSNMILLGKCTTKSKIKNTKITFKLFLLHQFTQLNVYSSWNYL